MLVSLGLGLGLGLGLQVGLVGVDCRVAGDPRCYETLHGLEILPFARSG
jgi:hypothetical protein